MDGEWMSFVTRWDFGVEEKDEKTLSKKEEDGVDDLDIEDLLCEGWALALARAEWEWDRGLGAGAALYVLARSKASNFL